MFYQSRRALPISSLRLAKHSVEMSLVYTVKLSRSVQWPRLNLRQGFQCWTPKVVQLRQAQPSSSAPGRASTAQGAFVWAQVRSFWESGTGLSRCLNLDKSPSRNFALLGQSQARYGYSAFRQKFPKLWTSVVHSFLQQIAQNKSWAHPKATTLPRIYKVEMEHALLFFCLAKPQSGGVLGCDLRHCTSEPFNFRRFVEACWAYGAYSQYPAWSRCCRSADVPRADRDHVGWSPWQRGFKERDTLLAILPFVWFFRHLKM